MAGNGVLTHSHTRAPEQDSDESLSRKQAAIFLTKKCGVRISARTLEKMASNNNKGGGPPFIRSGWRTLYYRVVDLVKWAEGRKKRVE